MKKILTLSIMALALAGSVLFAAPTYARSDCSGLYGGALTACEACRASADDPDDFTFGKDADGAWVCGDTDADVASLIRTIGNVLAGAVGGISIIFIIVAGIKYSTSGGDEKKVTSAKHTLTYAIIGLAIAVFAAVIVNLVINLISRNV